MDNPEVLAYVKSCRESTFKLVTWVLEARDQKLRFNELQNAEGGPLIPDDAKDFVVASNSGGEEALAKISCAKIIERDQIIDKILSQIGDTADLPTLHLFMPRPLIVDKG